MCSCVRHNVFSSRIFLRASLVQRVQNKGKRDLALVLSFAHQRIPRIRNQESARVFLPATRAISLTANAQRDGKPVLFKLNESARLASRARSVILTFDARLCLSRVAQRQPAGEINRSECITSTCAPHEHLAGKGLPMFAYFARAGAGDALSKRAEYARESGEKPLPPPPPLHHHHTSYPSGHKYKALFFSFSLRNFVTLSSSLLDQTHALFLSSTRTYIQMRTRRLFEQNKNLLLSLLLHTHTHTYVSKMEKK